jgi:hypothetical protein
MWLLPEILFALGTISVLVLGLIECVPLIMRSQVKKFDTFDWENTNFFSRLSNLEKKRWIAEEIYNRKVFGVRLIDDYTLEKLKEINPKEKFTINYDPPNYNPLQNAEYQEAMYYTPVYARDFEL